MVGILLSLAYSLESSVVLVDTIQKSVILSATLADLYSSNVVNNRDISIQPFATSSILQHHYQSNPAGAGVGPLTSGGQFTTNKLDQLRLNLDNNNNNNSGQMVIEPKTSTGKARQSEGGSLGNINSGLSSAQVGMHKASITSTDSVQVSFF